MNCFQITIFAGAKTTSLAWTDLRWRLWIAFKLLSLQGQRQRFTVLNVSGNSCELLSNYYLCRGKDNISVNTRNVNIVVNCFQITIFAGAKTTIARNMWRWAQLWIAFKLLSLQGQRQHLFSYYSILRGCELLSNYYLCRGKDNSRYCWICEESVVNCFQITIFAGAKTTNQGTHDTTVSCELLSNYYLCRGKDNINTKH